VIATGTPTLYGWIAGWNTATVPNGTYTLESTASYADGVIGTSAPVTIVVDNANPTTAVTVPANNATLSGGQWLGAGASSGVSQVQYELSGNGLSDDVIATAAPSIVGWLAYWDSASVPNGTYTLNSVATAGGLSGTSPPVTIKVNNVTPTVSILVPANDATVKGASVVLDALPSSGVTQVQFELSGNGLSDDVIGQATLYSFGWVVVWNSTAVSDGTYALTAVGSYPNGGASGTSPPISITVDN
jgi:hypothetical protein